VSPVCPASLHTFDYSDLIGKPFANHGRGPDSYDCYGLAKEVFRRCGIELPEFWVSCEDATRIEETILNEKAGGRWVRLQKPQVPCLVVLRFNSDKINHVGVYVGFGEFLHTAKKSGVHVGRIDHPYYRNVIEGYYIPAEVKQ
jgi:cell wall-associated NlpC family hydrolase